MTQLNRNNITNLYLYGQLSTPSNLVNDNLIRPEDNNVAIREANDTSIEVEAPEFMLNGGGRFALPSQFELIQKFFDLNTSIQAGTYDKLTLNNLINNGEFFAWSMQQYRYDDSSQPNVTDDFLDRVWVYNSMAFQIADNTQFIVDQNDNRRIENLAIQPYIDPNPNERENFDFSSNDLQTIILNALVGNSIDPSGIGRKVWIDFDYINQIPRIPTYNESDFEQDILKNQQQEIGTIAGLQKLNSLKDDFVDGLFNAGVIKFLYNGKPIIYGTVDNDSLAAVSVSPFATPTLYEFKDNGIVLIGGSGNDILAGDRTEDLLIGGDDNDTLNGFRGADILNGGGGDDRLRGDDGNADIAIFSGDVSDYDISSTSFLGIEEFTIADNVGTDGTDTLTDIELAQFADGKGTLIDGSFNTQSGEAPSTSTNFFDPGIPIQLGLTMPVSMIDGDAEYTVDISPFETNPQYNISFIIDTSASMDVNPTEFQEVKDAYTSLINYFKNNDIADDTNFGVVSFSKNATLYADLTADEAINTIQGLTTASPIEGTQYRDALGKGLDFFTQSPLRGENITNIAYFVSDGRSRSTYPEPTYINNARFLRSVANVQAFGLYDSTDPGTISESQINFVDSDQGVILSDASQLESAFTQSGLINDIDRIDILQDNSVIETIQPNQLTDSPLGLSYTGTIDDLDVSLNAANNITAEVSFVPDSKIASSGTVDYTVASNLDDSGAEFLTTIVDGGAADDEIIIGSIDLGAAGNDGNDRVVGNNFNNVLNGGDGNDTLFGHGGNDTITTDSGEDLVNGGDGIDTVNYVNLTFDPDVVEQRGDVTTINSTDTLIDVEYLQFSDVRVSTETLEVTPILEGTDITVTEGDAGTTITQFTFNLSSTAPNDIEFTYNTENIDAIATTDYVATLGTFTIPSGSTTATIDVEIIGDTDYEADEIFTLNLSAISGATFANNEDQYTLVAKIENDDLQTIIDPVTSLQYIAEYGVIDNLTDDFQTIDLTNNYTNPVVFAQPLSFNGPSTAAVRLDNITGNSFEIQAQEANYLDGSHLAEKVSYFVLEAGTWQLPSGEILQVGTTNSDQLVSNEWENITFDQQFETNPAVFSQVQTKNGDDFVRTRQKSISTDGFQFGMEEEEVNKNSGHANETLGWFAIEEGQGTWNGNNYQISTTGDNITHNWSSIDFDPNFSQAPQFLASLSSYDGSDPSGLRYRSLNQDTVEIKIEEDKSFDNEIVHTTETVSYLALEGEGLLIGQPQEVFAETGTISLTDAIETINLSNTYENPVVFVQPPSFNGSQPALVRLDNITNNSFDARIQEPDYLVDIGQGSHSAETLSYFVFEAGTWQLEDGTLLEIGNTNSSGLVDRGAGFENVDFDLEFDNTPVVISQVQTENETDFVRTRQRNTTVNSFDVAMEEEEANEGSGHATETIGYLAIEPGSGESGGFTYYADNTGDTVGSNWSEVDFNGLFSEAPQVLAGISSYDGFDPAGLRYRNLDPTGVEFKAEEEQSVDDELSHTRETVDFLLIEGSGSLSATPIDPFSSNGAIPIAEAIGLREKLISQFENPLYEVTTD